MRPFTGVFHSQFVMTDMTWNGIFYALAAQTRRVAFRALSAGRTRMGMAMLLSIARTTHEYQYTNRKSRSR